MVIPTKKQVKIATETAARDHRPELLLNLNVPQNLATTLASSLNVAVKRIWRLSDMSLYFFCSGSPPAAW